MVTLLPRNISVISEGVYVCTLNSAFVIDQIAEVSDGKMGRTNDAAPRREPVTAPRTEKAADRPAD
jgi:hypothetical protein